MIRSRMFTPMFRLYAGWAILALVLAGLFGIASNQDTPLTFDPVAQFGGDFPWVHIDRDAGSFPYVHSDDLVNSVSGPMTLGWKGAVGNHLGYLMWVAIVVIAGFLAGLLVAFRDADPEAAAEAVNLDAVPPTRAPTGANFWPIVAAFAAGMIAIGWATNTTVLIAGLGLAVVTAVAWTFRAWADRATGDDRVNREVYHRIIDPLRIPVLAVVGVALVVFGLSRVLLAVSKEAAIGIFLASFVFIAVLFALIAFAPKASKGMITFVFVLLGALILVGGVAAAVKGERNFSEGHEAPAGGGGTGTGGSGGQSVGGEGHGGRIAPIGPIAVQVTS